MLRFGDHLLLVLVAIRFWAMSDKLGVFGAHEEEVGEQNSSSTEPGTNRGLPVVNVIRISSVLEADLGFRAARDMFNSLPRWNDRFTIKIHTRYTKREAGQSVANVLRLFLQTMEGANKTFVALLDQRERGIVLWRYKRVSASVPSSACCHGFATSVDGPDGIVSDQASVDLGVQRTGVRFVGRFFGNVSKQSIEDFKKYCLNRPGCAVQRAVLLDHSVFVSNDIKKLLAADSTGQTPVVDYVVSGIGPNMGYAICDAYKATANWLLQPTFLGLERYDVRDIWRPLDLNGATTVQLNCTLDELRAAYNGSVFVTFGNPNYVDDLESVMRARHDGMTLEQIRHKIRQSSQSVSMLADTLSNPISYFAYDGGFALFTALYRTDERMERERFGGGMRLHQINSKSTPLTLWQQFADILHDELAATSFDGVTVLDGAEGRVAFDRNQSRIGGVELIQYQGLKVISSPNGQLKAVDNFVRVGFIASDDKVTIETKLLRFRTEDGRAPHVWRQKYNERRRSDTPDKISGSVAFGTIIVIVVVCIAAITGISVAAVIWHQKRLKRLRLQQDLAWLLPNSHLQQQNEIRSTGLLRKSLASTPTITAASFVFSGSANLALEYDIAVYYTKQDMRVHIRRLIGGILPSNATLTTEIHNAAELNETFDPSAAMYRLKHENVNDFVGICMDYKPTSEYLSLPVTNVATPVAVFKYQEKLSLRHTLQLSNNNDWSVDTELKYCFIADCMRGMLAIHEVGIVHGFLHTGNVVLDGKLTCKVTDYGLAKFGRDHEELEPVLPEMDGDGSTPSQNFAEKLAFRSPEQLRKGYYGCDLAKSDIYSVGIIMMEIILRQPPRFATPQEPNTPLEAKHMLGRIQQNMEVVPLLNSSDVTTNLRTFISTCASENAANRPSSMHHAHKSLMQLPEFASIVGVVESLILRLERYTKDLELVVTERTQALFEEAHRSERLLLQILPASVAKDLKAGRVVQPEYFENVSVYFSDIVDFASTIGARLAPMQVVDLLNSLYMAFDGVLEKYNVYKVETIGDAYMVASGIPQRNENKHADELCRFSLAILKTIQITAFAYRQSGYEQSNSAAVHLRIGLHCGPCMAGVIGIRLPRYCLFGDTINTASRMQSTGQPNKIHCSDAMRTFTELHFPNKFVWQNRGEITVKGLGVVTTHWLGEQPT